MKKEIWKSIKEYEDMYEVSTFGNVRSLDRFIIDKRGVKRFCKGRVLRSTKNGKGYLHVIVCKDSKPVLMRIHALVFDTFNGSDRSKLVIDHIDNDKENNNINNLQLITNRENVSKGCLLRKRASKYIGVFKNHNRWSAKIRINGNLIHLGAFGCETAAHVTYQRRLNELKRIEQ